MSILPCSQRSSIPLPPEERIFIKEILRHLRYLDSKWLAEQQDAWQLTSFSEVVRAALEFLKEKRSELSPKERGDAVSTSLEHKRRDIALLLLDSGPVDPYDGLIRAAQLGDQEVVDRLLQSDAIEIGDFICAAGMAAGWNHWDMAKALLLRAEITASHFPRACQTYESLLLHAARQGDQEIIRRLWPEGKEDARLQASMLFWAVEQDQSETASFILTFGPIDPFIRNQAVQRAASLGYQRCIDTLLPQPGLLSQNQCVMAADTAAKQGHWTVARSLLLYGNIQIDGEVPKHLFPSCEIFYLKFPSLHDLLIHAAAQNDLEILSRLTPTKPEELACQLRGRILCSAARYLQIPAVQFALNLGSIRKFDRGEAVSLAAFHGHQELLEILLASGPISGLSGDMAAKIAQSRGHLDIARRLGINVS